MKRKGETSIEIGGGFFGILFLILLTLKLAEIGQVAAWSWWWVTAPLWGPVAFVVGVFLLACVAVVIFYTIVLIVKLLLMPFQKKKK